jgi:hypothetical protein
VGTMDTVGAGGASKLVLAEMDKKMAAHGIELGCDTQTRQFGGQLGTRHTGQRWRSRGHRLQPAWTPASLDRGLLGGRGSYLFGKHRAAPEQA